MDQGFLAVISELRERSSKDAIQKLNDMFSVITNMKADELVVAYQTTLTTAKIMGIKDDEGIKIILKALETQMVYIGEKSSIVSGQKVRFCSVTSGKLFSDRFKLKF